MSDLPRLSKTPGCIYKNRDRWWWKVRLPGESAITARPLKPEGARYATTDRRLAEQVAREMYRRAIHQAEAKHEGRPVTVADLAAHYNAHMTRKHPSGTQAAEARLAMAALADAFGTRIPDDLTPADLTALREKLVDQGMTLSTINRRVRAILVMFRWAVTQGWLYQGVAYALECLKPLRPGDYGLAGRRDVPPVAWDDVERTLPHLSPAVRDMVLVQWHTGMRSGEVVQMRPCDIDRSGDIWLYRPEHHKTQRWGHERLVGLGPQAQAVLMPYLLRPAEQRLFVPAESERRRRDALHAARKTPANQGNSPGTHRVASPRKQPGQEYTSGTYCYCVAATIQRVNARAKAKAKAEGRKVGAGELITPWHPHQLRHAWATRSREVMDLDAVRAQMGHRTLAMTDHYARLAMEKLAREAARKMG
ncbi:MAG: site-specific integrase [Phycisphaerae bacterium]|nr:site-specific integrase [Phycisphaerae bacterium]